MVIWKMMHVQKQNKHRFNKLRKSFFSFIYFKTTSLKSLQQSAWLIMQILLERSTVSSFSSTVKLHQCYRHIKNCSMIETWPEVRQNWPEVALNDLTKKSAVKSPVRSSYFKGFTLVWDSFCCDHFTVCCDRFTVCCDHFTVCCDRYTKRLFAVKWSATKFFDIWKLVQIGCSDVIYLGCL